MKVITVGKESIYEVKKLYKQSFPKNEQFPFWLLLWKARKKNIDFLAFYDNEEFVGFTYLITQEDLTYILYLAVATTTRSKGYGSKILNLLKEMFVENRIMLNIESPDVKSDNLQQRQKRKAFYYKNEFLQTCFSFKYAKEVYDALGYNGNTQFNEYNKLVENFTGKILYQFFKPRQISK